jgi:stage II sporulation protein P
VRAAARGVVIFLSVCVLLRLLAAFGADIAAEGLIYDVVSREGFADGILRFELGIPPAEAIPDAPPPHDGPENGDDAQTGAERDATPYFFRPFVPAPVPDGGAEEPAQPAEPMSGTAEFAGGVSSAAPLDIASLVVNNTTPYELDLPQILSAPPSLTLGGGAPLVLILHTHGSEAYTPDAGSSYEASDLFRTEDREYNIIRVGDELAECLTARGFSVIHDTGIYDYPSYQGSYGRTDAVVASYMESYPEISLVIDLHRDAITAPDGSQYKTVAHIGDTTCSQIMFFMGTDAAGLQHPGWRENFKLSLYIQNEMNAIYPSLTRPIYLSQYRYNQHRSPGSLLVEVGSAGNTLDESLAAVRLFADAYANVIESLNTVKG